MSINLAKTRLGDWDVTWATYAFGAVDKVTPNITLATKDVKVGTIGDVVLGRRIIAVDGTITVEAREIDATLLQKLMPWYSTGSSVSLNPAAVHKDLYDYAAALTLHPTDVSGTGEDINLLKAVPTYQPMDRDGVNDDKVIVTFQFFPDRAQLPTLVYGYVGPVPE